MELNKVNLREIKLKEITLYTRKVKKQYRRETKCY